MFVTSFGQTPCIYPMLFLLATINKGDFRAFAFDSSTLEEGLDGISSIALSCDELVSVQLVEDASILHLPPQAFDGQPLSGPFKQLEQQWQAVLSSPPAGASVEAPSLADWYRQQVNQQQTNIARLYHMIDQVKRNDRWLQTVPLSESKRAKFSRQNQRCLTQYLRCLVAAQMQLDGYQLELATVRGASTG